MKKTTTVHTKVEDTDIKKMRWIAKKECTNVGAMIRKAIKLFIDSYK